MPTTVTLVLELDSKGAIKGVQEVGSEFGKLGSTANTGAGKAADGFKKMEAAQKKAHDSLQLISGAIGVQIPRDVEKVISKLPGLSTALSAGFSATAVLGVAAAVGEIGIHLDEVKEKALKTGRAMAAIFSAAIRNDEQERQAQQLFRPIQDQVENLRQAAAVAGQEGFGQITAQLKASNEQLSLMAKRFKEDIEDKFGKDSSTTRRDEARLDRKVQEDRAFLEQAANKEIQKLRRAHVEELRALQVQGALTGKSQIEQIHIQLEADLVKIDRRRDLTPSEKNAERSAVRLASTAQEAKLQRDILAQGIQTRLQAEAAVAKGEEQIRLGLVAKLNQITHQEELSGAMMQNERVAAEIEANDKIKQLRENAAEQLAQLQEQAAVDGASPFYRADAQIAADHAKLVRQIDKQLEDTVISKSEHDALILAADRDTNGRLREQHRQMAEQLGSDLESAYDDIANGNIGKRIVGNMKKLFFQIAANWLITMRQATGATQPGSGGGGILGGLGGLIFGPGSSGGTVFGGGGGGGLGIPGMPPGGVVGTPPFIGGFGFTGGSSFVGGPGGLFGGGTLNTPSVSDSAGASSGSGTVSIPGVAGALGKPGGLYGIGGLATIGGTLLGNKLGGPAAALGALIGIGGLAALYGSSASATAAVAPYSQFLGPLAGGLVGFGIGNQYGKVPGALSGAGTGALTGFLAAGPVGALIGGLVGLLGGIFGGLFGGSKRRRQAEQLAQQMVAQITQINAQYKGFQIDYASAITGLESIRTQGYPQFDQLKGEGRSVWQSSVLPKITSAESEINAINVERARRSSLLFGPPQFADGGQFRIGTGGAGYALLHDGEVVMNPAAVKQIGAKNLLAANESARNGGGASVGGGEFHVHGPLVQANRVDEPWLRNGGAIQIAKAIRRAMMEGYVA